MKSVLVSFSGSSCSGVGGGVGGTELGSGLQILVISSHPKAQAPGQASQVLVATQASVLGSQSFLQDPPTEEYVAAHREHPVAPPAVHPLQEISQFSQVLGVGTVL